VMQWLRFGQVGSKAQPTHNNFETTSQQPP
jgi:hypothetical protein